ncbi:MAG TPA: hypothetical protein VIF57_11685 [Polyangia bacterium]
MLALLSSAEARADGWDGAVLGGLGLFAPSDAGVTMSDPTTARALIGWSWQLPLKLFASRLPDSLVNHRIVPGFDLVPGAGAGASWRGRLGYRYDRSHVFGGAGVDANGGSLNLSPEIGVKFLHVREEPAAAVDMSLHLLARGEIAPASGQLRAVTFLLGWNLI